MQGEAGIGKDSRRVSFLPSPERRQGRPQMMGEGG